MTKRAFVAGHPIAHSRSPAIHTFWLKELGLTGTYQPLDIKPQNLPELFEQLRLGNYVGGNITIPHKLQAFDLCDRLTPVASSIGAVNTIYLQDNKIVGSNTDAYGFLANLDQQVPGWDEDLLDILVLGAGGATRAVLAALLERSPRRIIILNRTLDKAHALVAHFAPLARSTRLLAAPLDRVNQYAANASLLVNTTAIGMNQTRFDHLDLTRFAKTTLVSDIVYTPLHTPLLKEARMQGLGIVDGLGMLLHQAVPGFEHWFGVRPKVSSKLRRMIEADLA